MDETVAEVNVIMTALLLTIEILLKMKMLNPQFSNILFITAVKDKKMVQNNENIDAVLHYLKLHYALH